MTLGFQRLARPAVFGIALTIVACGGNSPTDPGGGGGGGGAGPSGATVTIENGRVNPASVTITVGQSVTFVNQDGRGHNISSDPHPTHTQCTELNIGNLANGQSRLTSAMNARRTCGYHDHDDPDNGNLKGTVIVQ